MTRTSGVRLPAVRPAAAEPCIVVLTFVDVCVHTPEAVTTLRSRGGRWARIGGDTLYDSKTDSPLLIPASSPAAVSLGR